MQCGCGGGGGGINYYLVLEGVVIADRDNKDSGGRALAVEVAYRTACQWLRV